jgi:hypothetical protein
VHSVSEARQKEVHTADWEIAIENLKKYKSPGTDQISAELIQAGGEILLSAIHQLINAIPWSVEGVCYCANSQKG